MFGILRLPWEAGARTEYAVRRDRMKGSVKRKESEYRGAFETSLASSPGRIARAVVIVPLAFGAFACQVYDASLLPDLVDTGVAGSDAQSLEDVTSEPTCSASCEDASEAARADVGLSDVSNDVLRVDAGFDARADVVARESSIDAAIDAPCEVGSPGCGIADASADADNCPNDPNKTQPGRCGCGTPDTDTDGDGTPDCLDTCPTDNRKTQAGLCGCGNQDPPDGGAVAAFCFKDAIIHRYAFNGTGTTATDSIGAANGTIQGGNNARQTGGSVDLTGDITAGSYAGEGFVSLPANILTGLTSATFEAWVTWDGASRASSTVWQRIFDFGNQTGNGANAVGQTYLFVTASAAQNGGPLRAAYTVNGPANETLINATTGPLVTGARKHLALVIDDPNDTMSLYLDGAVVGFVQLTGNLSAIVDTNSWLGRSQFAVDPELNGTLQEFRIYNVALSATQVQASFTAGPDPSYLP
jgi:hypothetical protein